KFLQKPYRQHSYDDMVLVPTKYNTASTQKTRRPRSYADLDVLRKKSFEHIKDWDSLNLLLPKEVRTWMAKQDPNVGQIPSPELPTFCRPRRDIQARSHRSQSSSGVSSGTPSA